MGYLITGAGGFIGGHLTKYLVRQGSQVYVVLRNRSQAIEELINEEHLYYKDVTTSEFNDMKIKADTCIHLASANDILSRDLEKGMNLSVVGTKRMLDYCVEHEIPNFIFFSTFQVYGTELTGTITENTVPGPENDYGLNHLFAEQYVQMYSRKYGLNCTIVRPSNIYGVPFSNDVNRWTLVPLCFCKEIMTNGQITLKSSGKQMRNFVSLDTIAECCETIALQKRSGFHVVNLASAMNLSILEISKIVKEVYEDRYHSIAKLKIESTFPQESNCFQVELEELKSLGITPKDNTEKLKDEIHGIFNFIERTNKN